MEEADLSSPKKTWRDVLAEQRPLLLPVAHDALTARLIERAGFAAYQIGGFAVIGARYGLPDIDLTHFAEKTSLVESISKATDLPVLVDCDDGYGDEKNVWHTVETFADRGVSAVFMEDQVAPKKCGHMSGKKVIPVEAMAQKVRAAVAAKEGREIFFIARTDAAEPNGVADAIDRAKRYRDAGADGVYVEGLTSVRDLETVGRALKGTPLAMTILERGGKTPWVAPDELHQMGFDMVLYPTTVIFRVVRAVTESLQGLFEGRQLDPARSVDMDTFEQIVNLPKWAEIEKKFPGGR
jgi:2-methylisocitrate lyase-like PEP mutase family enzyme